MFMPAHQGQSTAEAKKSERKRVRRAKNEKEQTKAPVTDKSHRSINPAPEERGPL